MNVVVSTALQEILQALIKKPPVTGVKLSSIAFRNISLGSLRKQPMNKDLLKLIETVNPDDTAMLDEIDARVWCLLNWSEYRGIKTHIFEGETKPEPCAVSSNGGTHIDNLIKYTRSRDALKSIRPEGWSVDTVSALKDDCLYFDATIWKIGAVLRGNLFTTRGGFLPTEELAELHVIISAITWERQNGK